MQDSTEIADDEASVSCTNLLKALNFLRKKNLKISTEMPYGEITVSCTNLLETLNFLKQTILQYFCNCLQLCNEVSVGMKLSLFLFMIMA